MKRTSDEIDKMIKTTNAECTVRTIAQLLDILQAVNERMDAMESKNKQTQNERNHPNKY